MSRGHTTPAQVPLGVLAVAGGLIALVGTYAYHYWFFSRNPDLACFELPLPNDAAIGSIDGVVTWLPGLTCHYVTTSGVTQTVHAGWVATLVAVVAVLIVTAGIVLIIVGVRKPRPETSEGVAA
ncbi:hypothetical protein [Agromyces bauzanensis]